MSRLAPHGQLILECGVAAGDGERWQTVHRSIDVRKFPTFDLLVNTLLSQYAVRYVGESVNQAGDPIPRKVFYCGKRKPVVGVVRGLSGSGKSIFTHSFAQKGVATFSSDRFLMECVAKEPEENESPFYTILRKGVHNRNMHTAAEKIVGANVVEEFCAAFVATLPFEKECFLIEGEVFSYSILFDGLKKCLKSHGAVVWSIERG